MVRLGIDLVNEDRLVEFVNNLKADGYLPPEAGVYLREDDDQAAEIVEYVLRVGDAIDGEEVR